MAWTACDAQEGVDTVRRTSLAQEDDEYHAKHALLAYLASKQEGLQHTDFGH